MFIVYKCYYHNLSKTHANTHLNPLEKTYVLAQASLQPICFSASEKKSHLILIKSKWSMKCLVISTQKPGPACLFSLQQVWNSNTLTSLSKLKEAPTIPWGQSGELVILFLAKRSAIIKQQLPFIILSFPLSLQLQLPSAPGNENMWHAA